MTVSVARSTSRGQVTLPKKWRSKFNTGTFKMTVFERKVVFEPLEIENSVPLLEEDETIVWDSAQDNDGKGLTPEEFLKLLSKKA